METDTIIKIVLALVPFVSLFGGFLLFHWGSLKTVVITCVIEFIIAVVYYHGSPMQTAEAALWGSVAVWPTLLITFTAQIFGYCYRKTGLMRVMLDSISELLPRDEVGHACALLGPVAGVFSNFEARASYPVVVPGLVELGYNPVQASGAALVFLTWIMPFQGLMIGAIIANLATHVPIPNIATAVGQFAIPDIFLCTYATFHILGLKFFNRESQIFFWLTTLPYVLSIFAFTQIWPHFYALGLIAGAVLNIASLYIYGMLRRRGAVVVGDLAAGTRTAPATLSAAATPASAPASGPDWARIGRGWGPLLVGFAYAAFMLSAWGSSLLSHLSFTLSATGFKPVIVNVFNTPAMPVLIGALSAYLFRTERSNMVSDIGHGLYRGISPMLTFVFGVGVMYLLVFTKQIDFLGSVMSSGGETLFKLVDAGLVVAGGTIFGSGTPTIFTFSTMQLPAISQFGLPLTLLLGMVVVGGIGVTNACKPPNLRFVANLVDVKSEQDWEIFSIGLKWVGWQVALFTALLFILVPFWK
jgi:L-lactate permease